MKTYNAQFISDIRKAEVARKIGRDLTAEECRSGIRSSHRFKDATPRELSQHRDYMSRTAPAVKATPIDLSQNTNEPPSTAEKRRGIQAEIESLKKQAELERIAKLPRTERQIEYLKQQEQALSVKPPAAEPIDAARLAVFEQLKEKIYWDDRHPESTKLILDRMLHALTIDDLERFDSEVAALRERVSTAPEPGEKEMAADFQKRSDGWWRRRDQVLAIIPESPAPAPAPTQKPATSEMDGINRMFAAKRELEESEAALRERIEAYGKIYDYAGYGVTNAD